MTVQGSDELINEHPRIDFGRRQLHRVIRGDYRANHGWGDPYVFATPPKSPMKGYCTALLRGHVSVLRLDAEGGLELVGYDYCRGPLPREERIERVAERLTGDFWLVIRTRMSLRLSPRTYVRFRDGRIVEDQSEWRKEWGADRAAPPGPRTVSMHVVTPSASREFVVEPRQHVTIGPARPAMLVVPKADIPAKFRLFALIGGVYHLNVLKGMVGQVRLEDGVFELDALEGRAKKASRRGVHFHRVALWDYSEGEVNVRNHTFHFFMQPARVVQRSWTAVMRSVALWIVLAVVVVLASVAYLMLR